MSLSISVHTLNTFQQLPQPQLTTHSPSQYEGFFRFFKPTMARELIDNSTRGPQYQTDTLHFPVEEQEEPRQPNHHYHRFVIAQTDNEIIGMILATWIKQPLSFWHYYLKFAEVRADVRGRGIGSALYHTLNKAPFLKGKVLQRSNTLAGGTSLATIGRRELTADSYACIDQLYALQDPPLRPGCYIT